MGIRGDMRWATLGQRLFAVRGCPRYIPRSRLREIPILERPIRHKVIYLSTAHIL